MPRAVTSVPAHTLTSRRARSAATARATARSWGLLRSFYSVVGRGSALRYTLTEAPTAARSGSRIRRTSSVAPRVEPEGIIRNQFETRA